MIPREKVFLFLLRNFWFVCVFIEGLYSWAVHRRAAVKYSGDPERKSEFERFFHVYRFGHVLPFFLLGMFQFAGNSVNPFYFLSREAGEWPVLAARIIVITCAALSIIWIYGRNGARDLARFHEVFYCPSSERAVKAWALVWLLFVLTLLVLGFLWKVGDFIPCSANLSP